MKNNWNNFNIFFSKDEELRYTASGEKHLINIPGINITKNKRLVVEPSELMKEEDYFAQIREETRILETGIINCFCNRYLATNHSKHTTLRVVLGNKNYY